MKILSIIAQTISADDINIPNGTPDEVLEIVLNLAYFVAGIIAVIIIIIAGFRITTAADPTSVTKAKDSIVHAIIAIVIILSAFVITQFLIGRF